MKPGSRTDAVIQVAGQQVHIDPQTGRIRQPTPQEAAALAASLEQQFGKRSEGITVFYLPNGAVGAQLNESFMEAMTVTRRPDGSLQFGHVTGLDQASRAVGDDASAKPTAETSGKDASGTKVSQPEPAAPKQTFFEETE